MKKLTYTFLCLVALMILLPLSSQGQTETPDDGSADRSDALARRLSVFNALAKELDAGFVDTIDAEKIVNYAIDAMLYQLDPYTEHYPYRNQAELEELTADGYAGIGAAIVKRGDSVSISRPYWDSPARRAGLRPGDIILAVDGWNAVGVADVGDVSKRLRGAAGTVVKVDVKRPYGPDSLRVDVTRDQIVPVSLPYYGRIDGDIAYIKLNSFAETSGNDVRSAIRSLMAQGPLKGIILDLRDNGGGIIDGAIQIAGTVLPRSTEVVRTRGRNANERIYKTTQSPVAADVPMVVLVSGRTASASEIVAGALQDLDRAVIIGERTYGKGLVQSTRQLPFGDVLKLTVAKYYLPSGRLIQALDYANRNEDGSPKHTPDSLANTFTTSRGRTVRDGGGITPDIVVKEPESNILLYNIVSGFWDFDYATRYAAAHPDAPDTLVVDSIMFEDFKAGIDPEKFKYDRQSEAGIKYLRDAAIALGYMNDSISAELDHLADMLRHDLPHDLDLNRKQVCELIDGELAYRYFDDATQVRRRLPSDSTVMKAVEVIRDPERYRSILNR